MNDDIEKRINELLDRGKKLLTRIKIYEGELNYWCDENDIPEFQAWLASAVNILNVAATPDSFFQKECTRLVSHDDLKRSVPTHIVQKLTGLLSSILEESNLGLLKRAEYIFTANTFDDFLEHASEYHKAGKKIESSILASAVFEDAVRKLGTEKHTNYTKKPPPPPGWGGFVGGEKREGDNNPLVTRGLFWGGRYKKNGVFPPPNFRTA